ncbi:MAG: LysR family transcriptional regulator [Eubacteriales bacterium]
MLDNRIFTFLELCNQMNYHKTAEALSMTQPAVTQHIKYLENLYQCNLFEYANKKLSMTKKATELEKYARSIIALHDTVEQKLAMTEQIVFNIGATKTIGEYTLDNLLFKLLSNPKYEINLLIDNTEKLLERLNHFQLDVVMLEGFFDKEQYDYQLITKEEIIGICANDHPFANREVSLEEIFRERVLLREKGSGTRAIFENFLFFHGYSMDSFYKKSSVSSNRLLERAIEQNLAISFVYDTIPNKNENISTFRIKDAKIFYEFNYVFLNREKANEVISLQSAGDL